MQKYCFSKDVHEAVTNISSFSYFAVFPFFPRQDTKPCTQQLKKTCIPKLNNDTT